MTANEWGYADAALVRRFRQAQTKQQRTVVFADVVRKHGDAVLRSCAERLWPDPDAAVAAASDVLIAARLAMADATKLPRPDRLRGWLLGIAAQAGVMHGLPARVDDINWEAVRHTADVPRMQDSSAKLASLRPWLERMVATLPEPRQRMYQLFVVRGLDSRKAARELGTTVAEVRRLRRENRQAILRAFEVTALADADMALDLLGSGTPGCAELRHLLADARHDGDPRTTRENGRRHTVVLPTAARLTLSTHLGQCRTCQDRRDDCMARWVPELLPVLAKAELHEQVMEESQSIPELRRPGAAPSAHRRVASVGAVAATGAGLLVALLLLAFVWPGFLQGAGSSAGLSSQDPQGDTVSGNGAPQAMSSSDGVPGNNHGRPVRPGTAGPSSSLPPVATGSSAAPSSASVPPSAYYTVPPSTSPTSPAQPTSGPPPTISPATPSPTASSPQPTKTSPAPSPDPSTTPATTPPPSTAPSTPTPTPSVSTATPTPTPTTPTPTSSPSATSSPSPSATASPSPSATASPSATSSAPATSSPSATSSAPATSSASPTTSTSTAAPSATATS